MNYTILERASFKKDFYKRIPKHLQADILRRIEKLSENPFVGRPLSYPFFRELKASGFRIYYLIYESTQSVYVVNLSDKKDQQKIINSIMLLLDVYKKEIEKMME